MAFNSSSVIIEHSNVGRLRTYLVGFDLNQYRYDALVNVLLDALVDFAFGYHEGIQETYKRDALIEAAKSIYKIDTYKKYKEDYIDKDNELDDENINEENKYLKRGEFGELILHVLSRDFMKTIPLLSKIYFKDSDGMTVHGFDLVHIGPDPSGSGDSLYLGESKLYYRKNGNAGKSGIKDLLNDIKQHFDIDFLNREITLISKKDKYKRYEDYIDKNTIEQYEEFLEKKNKWFNKLVDVQNRKVKMQDFIESVTVPLLCTYQSKIYENYNDENDEGFIREYESEMNDLHSYLIDELGEIEVSDGQIDRTKLNIILLLFPIKSKRELLKKLHEKLFNQQNS
ncbi:DUF1837 domain-containing protein [Aggregatibacter segnis]|uniref:HamA C-terminal domain-containing protein n=1 Tax=Aggregatibacter segnis TaxID=739 RepID=UPI0025981A82|nr:DUF1837 domain-containing protein [Aggregatibacter segnis]